MTRSKALALLLIAAVFGTNDGFAQAAGSAAPDVRRALGVLNRVVNHTQRLITAHNFARLPHEDGEFKEAVEALERSIAAEPAAFKEQVEPLIKQAEARSHALAAASRQSNATTINVAHDALAESVQTLTAAFPTEVRSPAAAPSAK